MQTLLCSIALIFMNGAYLAVSYNMESLVFDEDAPELEQVVSTSSPSLDFEIADILDLDILDFTVEELAESNEQSAAVARSSERTKDRVEQ